MISVSDMDNDCTLSGPEGHEGDNRAETRCAASTIV